MRLLFYHLRKKGLPTPPWNPVLGNLPVMAELQKKGPSDTRQAESFALLSTETPGLEAGFYIDVWPFSCPMLVVTSPTMAIEACQTYDLPKPDVLQQYINPMAGGSDNLFVSNGAHWKKARELFNHGFSMTDSLSHVSGILEEAEVFVKMLNIHAQTGDIFSLDQLTCRYVMDIIGNVALNTRFNHLEQHNPIAAAMRDTIELECGIEAGNFLERWSPRRLYRQWQNGRTMNHLIGVELEKRFQEWKQNEAKSLTFCSKSIMDIVISEYMKSRPREQQHLDPKFKSWATIQMRLFLVFGAGASSACQVLRERPQTINQLPYTHAIVKETLRLFPPANGLRGGLPHVSLRDEHGRSFPTEGCAIWIVHTAVHRNPAFWPEPHSFIPERWLVEQGHPLYPPAGGWRPFEHGPRNCIGQNLSLLGIITTLAMVVRQFDFHDAYAEYDGLNPSDGIKTMFGERAYMIQKGSGHPAQGFPCKVTVVPQTGQKEA
ncbi:uncharacterized protein N7484_000061 [Penicillium longicatenatum]|uniref:uncharacterized protein n=1 Tax=Penicillium longicatenatum TaxID=1561947 RepID=UPI00254738B7|nr:uncharacterized protein N7484_000061 [Penicillium longicatenatum]KAJ5660689.1 hypothetical protein N7484_000061 [Penicillium longicatenatum]